MKKKGWIKLAEAFISILIIGLLLGVMISERRELKNDFSNNIELRQNYLLNKVQINESLRESILELSSLPKDSTEIGFPPALISSLNEINTNLLLCEYKICIIGQECLLEDMPDKKEIYISSIIISANQEIYSPRNLNLFCWER